MVGAAAQPRAGRPSYGWAPPAAVGRKSATEYCAAREWTTPHPEDIRSTYLEIVNQGLSGVASAVSARARKEISCVRRPRRPSLRVAWRGRLRLRDHARRAAFPLLAVFAASVANILPTVALSPMPNPLPRARQAAGPAAPTGASGSIDLLLDVELPVSVSFGRAQLMLKDVIKLTTGSIVELNRAFSEPVEVIVNNCVIARGEVVVVEGNYGIRIKQVISRQERLRTLY